MKCQSCDYEGMSVEQLKAERSEVEERIEKNDERLTADSSADLDNDLDKRDIIDEIFVEWVRDTTTDNI